MVGRGVDYRQNSKSCRLFNSWFQTAMKLHAESVPVGWSLKVFLRGLGSPSCSHWGAWAFRCHLLDWKACAKDHYYRIIQYWSFYVFLGNFDFWRNVREIWPGNVGFGLLEKRLCVRYICRKVNCECKPVIFEIYSNTWSLKIWEKTT